MRPKERRDSGQSDLFRARLDQIVDLDHALARLGRAIDWRFLEERFGAAYTDRPGHPPLPTRLMAGLAILKAMHDLSDEALCDRWIENPYFQLFCGEEFFRHQPPFDRSSMTRWRQRMGEDKLNVLVQESLATAVRTKAANPPPASPTGFACRSLKLAPPPDFTQAIVDTTVQPKAVTHPTDAKLMHRARERLVRLAQKLGVELRQSYERVGKYALIKQQRYPSACNSTRLRRMELLAGFAHAKQFKRANRSLRQLKTYLGRVMRDVRRKIRGDLLPWSWASTQLRQSEAA